MKEEILNKHFRGDQIVSYNYISQSNVILNIQLCETQDGYIIFYKNKFYIPDSLDDFTEKYSKEIMLEEVINILKKESR